MKNLMLVVNFIIFLGSIVGIAWYIICGQFGIAWIAAACAAFGYCNVCAIEVKDLIEKERIKDEIRNNTRIN